jgi:hypothetical protein
MVIVCGAATFTPPRKQETRMNHASRIAYLAALDALASRLDGLVTARRETVAALAASDACDVYGVDSDAPATLRSASLAGLVSQ